MDWYEYEWGETTKKQKLPYPVVGTSYMIANFTCKSNSNSSYVLNQLKSVKNNCSDSSLKIKVISENLDGESLFSTFAVAPTEADDKKLSLILEFYDDVKESSISTYKIEKTIMI